MVEYFRSVWSARYFWLHLVWNDLKNRYRRSILGVGWSMVYPIVTAIVTGIVFHHAFQMSLSQYFPFVLCGLATWAYITGVVVQGGQAYVHAESYIRQHPSPLAIYPLRITLGAMTHLVLALGVVAVVCVLQRGASTLAGVGWLVPALAMLFVLGWSAAVLSAGMNVVFRDLQHIFELGFQVLFYLTPILYPTSALRETAVAKYLEWNPIAAVLDIVRSPLLNGGPGELSSYAAVAGMTAVAGVAAAMSLRMQQRHVIFYL